MRRVAMVLAVLAAGLWMAAAPADAKRKPRAGTAPVVTSVSPMRAVVGQQLILRGRNFRPGKGRNGIGFKADGRPIVFVRSGLSTRRLMTVPLTAKLARVVAAGPQRFRLRVLTKRFGRRYTSKRLSPVIGPAPGATAAPAAPTGPTLPAGATGSGAPVSDCNPTAGGSGDQDADRLTDGLEVAIGTDACSADSDRDGVEDGYEYRSAIDLNDDEYQQPNQVLPYPGKRPYPNPLDAKDADVDYDGDLLDLREEYRLWLAATPAADRSFADPTDDRATPLTYSDGLQYSISRRVAGRRVPALAATADPSFSDFFTWASGAGYANVYVVPQDALFDIRDLDLDGTVSAAEANPLDADGDTWISDDERDADVDGLSNYTELHGEMLPSYWTSCYSLEPAYGLAYVPTKGDDADSDGDGIRDGADDEDHDGVPNLMELSRIKASGLDDRLNNRGACVPKTPLTVVDSAGKLADNHPGAPGWVNPFNPCRPYQAKRNSCSQAYLAGYAGPTWWALQ